MAERDAQRDPVELLDALAAEFTERQRRGECPSASEYAAQHPDLAAEIRELFPTIAATERLKARLEHTSDGRASLGAVKLERLGDFRIVREIGRGGMGIVYEAEQESLGRRVAIKVLPRQALLDEKHLRRFQREARIAAHLHHTNIVEVFGVGDQEGFHYYVMQYIDGVGLDTVIQRLRTSKESRDWRTVASMGRQAAEALAYAHSRGTLHRDIKPANLLVDAHGAVWITDFGLAKAAQSESVTLTGEVSGTLRYMAPEQFSGQTDARSDIYSLGLTLYELLTLRPAYDESDRSRLLHCIAHSQPPAPRTRRPSVPRDLETIVMKAIAREPGQRYATAGALAADLQCFLEDRPIQARRAFAVERFWRWCRRNPAVASLAGAALLLAVLVAVVATAGYVRTRAALDGEAQQRKKAEANAEMAIEAMDRIFERFSPSLAVGSASLPVTGSEGASIQLPSPPALSKGAAALLEDLLTFYDRAANEAGNDPKLRQKVAQANCRVGDIRQRIGQPDPAVAAYHRAIAIYQELDRASPGDPAFRIEIAAIRNELGRLFRATRRTAEADQSHRAALELLQPLGPAAPARARFEMARACYFLSARERPEPGAEPNPGPPPGSRKAPPPKGEGGVPPPEPPGPPEPSPGEREYLQQAVSLLSDLKAEGPSNPGYRHLLALCYREQFHRGLARGAAEAAEALNQATQMLERLASDLPSVPDYTLDLAETYGVLDPRRPLPPGYTYAALGERYRKALSLSEGLVAAHPYIPRYMAAAARFCDQLGAVLEQTGKLAEAEQSYRKAVELQASLASQFPEAPTYKLWLTAHQHALVQLLLRRGKPEEARSLLEQSVAVLTALLAGEPGMEFIHELLARSHEGLAAVLRKMGEERLASQAERQAEEHRRSVHRGQPSPPHK